MVQNLYLLCLVISLLMGCAARPAFSSPSTWRGQTVPSGPVSQVTNLRYTLGPLDVLEITLYARPELGREVTISRKGTFRFPLIGQVRARGLTVSQLEKTLTLRLQDAHILEPHVVVTVKAYHNQHIFLLGEVYLPGVYALPDQVDLKDLIIQAQGLTAEADDYLIIIQGERQGRSGRAAFANHMREIPGTRVDLRKLMSGQVTPAVRLQSGDTIYVPRRLAGYAFSRFTCPDAGWHCPVSVALQVR